MKSIYLRNFAATAAIVALCILTMGLAVLGVGRNYIVRDYKQTMATRVEGAAELASVVAEEEGLRGWSTGLFLNVINSTSQDLLFITDTEGEIIVCSESPYECCHLGKDIDSSILDTINENGQYAENTLPTNVCEHKVYLMGLPIHDEDTDTIGYIFIYRNLNEVVSAWDAFTNLMLIVTFLIFALTMVASLITSKNMAKPLDEIAAASRKFARGDFSVRVKQVEDTNDEMGALIDSFNKMADSLEASEARRSEFIANVSHELRTPMTTISGFADGILDGTIAKEDQNKYLISIRDETRRLSRLVREMLDASQMKASVTPEEERTTFDLVELMVQTMLSFESRATQKNLDVDPQLPENSIMVVADKDSITRVIYNLIDNAVKFAFPDSCIVIKVFKQDGKAYVSVKDTGETIPPDDLPFIFDRFHKSDRSRSIDKDGVGLGLYLVKEIINRHDEDIAVKSENNETEFVFTLPLAK